MNIKKKTPDDLDKMTPVLEGIFIALESAISDMGRTKRQQRDAVCLADGLLFAATIVCAERTDSGVNAFNTRQPDIVDRLFRLYRQVGRRISFSKRKPK